MNKPLLGQSQRFVLRKAPESLTAAFLRLNLAALQISRALARVGFGVKKSAKTTKVIKRIK